MPISLLGDWIYSSLPKSSTFSPRGKFLQFHLELSYYIANVNPECWSQYKARMFIDRIQPYLITNMSSNARRALTLLRILISQVRYRSCIMVSKCNKFDDM